MADHHNKYYDGGTTETHLPIRFRLEKIGYQKVILSKIFHEWYIFNVNVTHINIHLLVNILIVYVIPLSMGLLIEVPTSLSSINRT